MTNKDWILLIVPIVSNLIFDGVVIFILQKFVLDRYIKRRLLKDEIVINFLNKLKNISDHLIEANFDSMKGNPDIVTKHIIPIQDLLADTTKYYNTNIYDLRQFKGCFDDLTNNWMCFQNTLNEYASKDELTEPMRLDLGIKMQHFFDSLAVLVEEVRKKY